MRPRRGKGRAAAPVCALAVGLLALACQTTISLADLDRLQRSVSASTTIAKDSYTLWSPFEVITTRDWIAMIEEELPAMSSALGTELGEALLVLLTPVEGLGPGVSVEGKVLRTEAPAAHPLHGVEGHALDRQIVLFVDAPVKIPIGDGEFLFGSIQADSYRETLRHELGHVFAGKAGIRGADWLSEGTAQYLASLRLVEGRLVDEGAPVEMVVEARGLPRERRTIEHLLAWEESGERILAGEEQVDRAARTLCGLFVRYLLDRQDEPELCDRLRAVAALPRASLRALEDPWQAWLDAEG